MDAIAQTGMPQAGLVHPFTDDEEMFRDTMRAFIARDLEPNLRHYEDQGFVDRELWLAAGRAGLLGCSVPEEYGGPGGSELCGVIRAYELGRSPAGATIGSSLTADIATHILMQGGSELAKRRWLPGILAGEILQCMPLTEAAAGSDVTAIKTTARREGEHYILNGSKTFITNGGNADLMYVVAKTDATQRGRGMSMFLVESNTPGITRRPQKTMGYRLYDVAEIFFDEARVPAENIFRGEGRAIEILFSTFAHDRLEVASRALGEAELGFDLALEHVRQRRAFGQTVFDFQNTQFKLAEMKTDLSVGRAFLYDGIRKFRAGAFGLADGSMVKMWMTEMSCRVIDMAMQFFGGSGYMDEMTISRLYTGSRLHRLYAGTTELQKVTIAKSL